MASQILTKDQLIAKGFNRKQIVSLLKWSETRMNSYLRQHIRNGNFTLPNIQKHWDAEARTWDHLKATLTKWDES